MRCSGDITKNSHLKAEQMTGTLIPLITNLSRNADLFQRQVEETETFQLVQFAWTSSLLLNHPALSCLHEKPVLFRILQVKALVVHHGNIWPNLPMLATKPVLPACICSISLWTCPYQCTCQCPCTFFDGSSPRALTVSCTSFQNGGKLHQSCALFECPN